MQMWDLLAWQGKHPQAPVAVAAKPNYFSELDMKQTIRNMLKHHPAFFSSHQMLASLKSGDITALDRSYFCNVSVACLLSIAMYACMEILCSLIHASGDRVQLQSTSNDQQFSSSLSMVAPEVRQYG